MEKMKIELMPHTPFLKEDGTFDKEKALNYSGKIAGICYSKEGFKALEKEKEEITKKRNNLTLNLEHHSVFDHLNIGLNLSNVPKIVAMLLNNEKQYNTSEKSARYTPVIRKEGGIISQEEEVLYNKWMHIFKEEIKKEYSDVLKENKIEKLAQENSRYLVTVFMPTELIYTVPLAQLNKITSFMNKMIKEDNKDDFKRKIIPYLKEFVSLLSKLNVLEERLQINSKNRSFSLFGEKLKEEYFGDVYSTNYKTSLASLAQAHRHRTIDYEIFLLKEKEYFIPPIIKDNPLLVKEWLKDIQSLAHVYPQGELVLVNETGTYQNFLLKAKERLCSNAQLEIANQTKKTLEKYQEALQKNKHPLSQDIAAYTKGARCTFPDYQCSSDCKFPLGKTLKRKI